MHRVLTAETAILVHLQAVRVVLLVLHGVVVALLALGASQSDLYSHFSAPPVDRIVFASLRDYCALVFGHKKIDPFRGIVYVIISSCRRQAVFAIFLRKIKKMFFGSTNANSIIYKTQILLF